MTTLREAAQQALEALEAMQSYAVAERKGLLICDESITALRAALEQQEQATGKDSLQVPQHVADQLTTADLAWLETRRLVRVWKELGEMRWMGADNGWDRAIEAVRARLDKECQDVLAWKEKVEASEQTAAQLLQKLRGMKDD